MSNTDQYQLDGEVIMFPKDVSDSLYIQVSEIIGNDGITQSNIIMLLLNTMQLIEGYDNIVGIQKKALALKILNSITDDKVKNKQDNAAIKILIQMTLPSVIDTLVSVDNGELGIKLKQCCVNLFCSGKTKKF